MKDIHYLNGVRDLIVSMTENGYREQAAESLNRLYLNKYLKAHECLFVCSMVLCDIHNTGDAEFWSGEWNDYQDEQVEYLRHKEIQDIICE